MDNLSLIAAIGNYFELGLDNHLIWKIPEDLAFYKKMTMGKNIIMGRKTFESMPSLALKGRNPIILSSHTLDNVCDVITFDDFYKLIDYVKKTNEEFMVVGGSSIYEQFLPYVNTMYLTELQNNEPFEADTFFPEFDETEWNIQLMNSFMDNDIPYIRNKYVRKR